MQRPLQLPLDIRPDIKEALKNNEPVVALESTIITHGMEYPQNMETALQVEKQISDNGAIPATIAIVQGRIVVGLNKDQIEYLAKEGRKCLKCSRRDFATALVKKQNGSTTVAATMICAQYAGIKIFVTGGIGGVHRGAENTFDVSADLNELGKTQVCVISAGAKSILDIPKTLEYLETQGVPTLAYKQENLPMFFTSDSGYKCSGRIDSEREAAEIIHTQFTKLNFQTGMIIGVPIPKEEEANGEIIQKAIDQAISEMNAQKVVGAEQTPFLLKRVNEITQGQSSKSNIALIKNNAQIGARIAVELSKVSKKKDD
ncbi:hypothetical protein PPERSA_00318 [Pseudocohnilembus persalinus]|uniref:Pseudouridine-5'-phosphate glycosidase n=1 Tax=Pseudocohnilembus persalinus TaxID=266149 RepID=A0A0V0QHG1_PSEPJ|nr:hypothetical protein PPERSA_00318 [Pseudocohnilembus persalinus]|eukprot:KRX01611.1 hypothetical protein PPERSA_00318 [Pseudocohnilembus persalinus]